jgi:hypothetical protein
MSRPLLSLPRALPLIASVSLAAGCASTFEAVKEEVARTEATVQQIDQSGVTRDAGAIELEQAKDKAAAARRAMDAGDDKDALRLAEQARLDADLAQAKARSHSAHRSAEEVRVSIEQLRREAMQPANSAVTPSAPNTTPPGTMSPMSVPAADPRM